MFEMYITNSGADWSTRTLIWSSNQIVNAINGGLYDAELSVEINKAGTLDFKVTPSFPFYNSFVKNKTVITVLQDRKDTLFRGPVRSIKFDLFKQKNITANSDLIYLTDSLYESDESDVRSNPDARFRKIIQKHNELMVNDPEKIFTVGSFSFASGADKETKYAKSGGYTDTLSKINSDMKDLNGYLSVRYSDDFSVRKLDYKDTLNVDSVHDIKFSVNIIDFDFEENDDDLFTVLIPTGSDDLTIEGISDTSDRTVKVRMPDMTTRDVTVKIDGKYLKILEGIEKYGYIYTAENFTVDSNDKTAAKRKGGSDNNKGKQGIDEKKNITVYRKVTDTSGCNPYEQGWFVKRNNGKYYRTSHKEAYPDTQYYSQYVVDSNEFFKPAHDSFMSGLKTGLLPSYKILMKEEGEN